MADDNKTPIDQLLDLFVYAPLGLALTARDQLPSLVDRGRQQVTQQTTLAKMMGQYAVKEAEKELRARLEKLAEPPPPPGAGKPAPEPTPASSSASSNGAASNNGATSPAPSNGKASDDAAPAAAAPAPKPSGDHLAIPGYDTLSASQVVQRLPGLSTEELAAVRAYEEATRGRRTILSKIGQLEAEST
ncbi:MAG TPA: hypothetical protein VM345_19530 [Acidimicrobiales bacterium]|nr:hypothetical protein [Acidimicrobiales bacterium]